VGELISKEMQGRVRLEDAGFDWKVRVVVVLLSRGGINQRRRARARVCVRREGSWTRR
jgi:hypothetical protein